MLSTSATRNNLLLEVTRFVCQHVDALLLPMRIILLMAVLLHILVNLYCICDLYVEVSLIIFWILYPSSLGDILSMVTVLMLPHFKYCMRYERINKHTLASPYTLCVDVLFLLHVSTCDGGLKSWLTR